MGSIIGGLTVIGLWIAAIIGYVLNIVKLAGILLVPGAVEVTGELVMRLIGLFPIVGMIVGWL